MKKSKAANAPRIPQLRKNGQFAYVSWLGKRIYLGRCNTPETDKAYRQWVSEYVANGYCPPLIEAQGEEVTVAVLCEHFLQRPEFETLTPNHREQIKNVIQHLIEWHGDLPASQFGALKLRALRDRLIAGTHAKDKEKPRPLTRGTIAKWIAVIRGIFRHGASLELIPVTYYQGLLTLEPLKYGRSNAKETDPIKPVPEAHIKETLPMLPNTLQAVVKLQLLTAARPSELLTLKPCMIDRSGKVWTAILPKHKTMLKGKNRTLYFGSKAQAILKPFMLRDPDAYLFDPREAMRQRWAACDTHRRPDQKPNETKTDRTISDYYTATTYRHAIERACKAADPQVPNWTPYQLRHNAATAIRKEYGIQGAQVFLGHSEIGTTQIYAETDNAKALEIAAQIG